MKVHSFWYRLSKFQNCRKKHGNFILCKGSTWYSLKLSYRNIHIRFRSVGIFTSILPLTYVSPHKRSTYWKIKSGQVGYKCRIFFQLCVHISNVQMWEYIAFSEHFLTYFTPQYIGARLQNICIGPLLLVISPKKFLNQ